MKKTTIKSATSHLAEIPHSRLSQAMALALITAASAPAMAGSGSCKDGFKSIGADKTDQCVLEDGDSVWVKDTGSIDTTAGFEAAISFEKSAGTDTIGDIVNDGTLISDGYGTIYIYGNAGDITNNGLIQNDSYYGIYIYNDGANANIGNVTNNGTIDTYDHGIYIYSDGERIRLDSLVNNGTISSEDGYGIYTYSAAMGDLVIKGDVINSGLIEADDQGIYLYNAKVNGSVINSGTILSGDTGLYVHGEVGGNVKNTGTIVTDGDFGIYVYSTVLGNVNNSGFISNTSEDGIYVYGEVKGDVKNLGTIEVEDTGITIANIVRGDVINSGEIASLDDGCCTNHIGLYIYGEVKGDIVNSGTITSDDGYGIYIYAEDDRGKVKGVINNSGVIESYYTGIYLYGDPDNERKIGGINNSGTISSAYGFGIYLYGDGDDININGDVINSGLIESEESGIYIWGSVTGDVTNSGTIETEIGDHDHGAGIYIYGEIGGNLTNSGVIRTEGSGIYVYGHGAEAEGVGGNVLNTGSIYSDEYSGIYIYADVEGDIKNTGVIDVYEFGIRAGNVGGNVINKGTIITDDSGAGGIYIYGTVDGNVKNSGYIEANGGFGIYVYAEGGDNVNSVAGNVVNSGEIIADGHGIYLYGDVGKVVKGELQGGNVTNSGYLESTDYTGLYIYSSNVRGDITNSGTIVGYDKGIYLYGEVGGDVINSGLIETEEEAGIYLYAWGGLDTTVVEGDVVNTGTIYADEYGIATVGVVRGDVRNEGVIESSDWHGMYLYGEVKGDVVNSGRIRADEVGIYVYAEDAESVGVGGNLINSGLIEADAYGIYVYGEVAGNVKNSGNIDSDYTGVYIYGSVGGNFVNSGTISSSDGFGMMSRGYDWDTAGVGGDFKNTGYIESEESGMYAYAEVGGDIINAGTIISSDQAGIYVYAEVGGDINNSGYVEGGDDSAGIYIYGDDTIISGDLINSGTITHEDNYGRSIFIDDDVQFEGEVINRGVISGDLQINAGVSVTNEGLLDIKNNDAYISGDYTQSGDGILAVDVRDINDSGVLTVDGSATFKKDTTIQINALGASNLKGGNTIEGIVDTEELNASTFNVVDNELSLRFKAVADTRNGEINIKVRETGIDSIEGAVGTSNLVGADGVGAFVDTYIQDNPDSTMAYAFGSMNSVGEVSDGVQTLLPALSGGVAQASLGLGNAVTSFVGDRQSAIASGDMTETDQDVWVKVFNGETEQDRTDGVAGYEVEGQGVAFGVELELSENWDLGYAFAAISGDVDSENSAANQNVDIDTIIGKVYGSRRLDEQSTLNLQLGLGKSDNTSRRTLINGDVASADYVSRSVDTSIEYVRNYEVDEKSSYQPYISLDYKTVDVEAYKETGAGDFSLTVDDDSADSLVLGVGVTGLYDLSEDWTVSGELGLGNDLQTDRASVTYSFAGDGTQFTSKGIEPDSMVYNLGLGAEYALDNGGALSAQYKLEQRDDYTDDVVSLKAKWVF